MEVEACGFHLMPDSFIGASSDGKVLCRNVDTCSQGCLEIKCPSGRTILIDTEVS